MNLSFYDEHINPPLYPEIPFTDPFIGNSFQYDSNLSPRLYPINDQPVPIPYEIVDEIYPNHDEAYYPELEAHPILDHTLDTIPMSPRPLVHYPEESATLTPRMVPHVPPLSLPPFPQPYPIGPIAPLTPVRTPRSTIPVDMSLSFPEPYEGFSHATPRTSRPHYRPEWGPITPRGVYGTPRTRCIITTTYGPSYRSRSLPPHRSVWDFDPARSYIAKSPRRTPTINYVKVPQDSYRESVISKRSNHSMLNNYNAPINEHDEYEEEEEEEEYEEEEEEDSENYYDGRDFDYPGKEYENEQGVHQILQEASKRLYRDPPIRTDLIRERQEEEEIIRGPKVPEHRRQEIAMRLYTEARDRVERRDRRILDASTAESREHEKIHKQLKLTPKQTTEVIQRLREVKPRPLPETTPIKKISKERQKQLLTRLASSPPRREPPPLPSAFTTKPPRKMDEEELEHLTDRLTRMPARWKPPPPRVEPDKKGPPKWRLY